MYQGLNWWRNFSSLGFLVAVFVTGSLQAATVYWNGGASGSNDWNAVENWSTASDATMPNPDAVPGAGDMAVFSINAVTGAVIVNLNGPQTVNGLQLGGSQYSGGVGAVTIVPGSEASSLTVGAGGINHADWTGAGDNIAADVVLGTDQTWSNATAVMNVAGNVTGNANLTIGSGSFALSGAANSINGNIIVGSNATLTAQGGVGLSCHTAIVNGTFNAAQATLNPSSGSITLNQWGRLATTSPVSSNVNIVLAGAGGASYLSNSDGGNAAVYTGTITQLNAGTFLDDSGGNGTVVLAGTADNAGLSLWARGSHLTQLAKNSSPTVHAINAGLQISDGTLQIAGAGDYQINPKVTVNLSYNNGVLDLNGHNAYIDGLIGGNSTELVTNSAAGTTSTLVIGNNGYNNGNFGGVLCDGAGILALDKIGPGTATLSGTATYGGATTVNAGTLVFSGNGLAMASSVTVNAGTLSFGGTGNVSTGAIDVKRSATMQSDSSNENSVTNIVNSFSPSADVILNGGLLSVHGHTTGQAATVTADFTVNSNFAHNVDTSGLTVGQTITVPAGVLPNGDTTTTLTGFFDGGTTFSFNSAAAVTQSGVSVTAATAAYSRSDTIHSLSIKSGASTVSAINYGQGATNNFGNTVLNLGPVVRNAGATVDFTLPAGAHSATNGVTTVTANTAGAILGGWATVTGTDWAVSAGDGTIQGNITPLGSYDANSFAPGKNTDVVSDFTASGGTTNCVRFSAGNACTLTLPTGTNVIASGGILVTNASGNVPAISGGSLTSGNGDLVVHQYNTANPLTISTAIVDAGAPTGLTKSGPGTLVLNGVNTYSGPTNINAGSVTVPNTGTLGSKSAVNLAGGASLAFTNLGGQIDLPSIGAVATGGPTTTQPAANAIDGNLNSRWETQWTDPGWMYVNLQGVYNLSSVKISWETAGAQNFVLQTATNDSIPPDGTNNGTWTTVDTVTGQASYGDRHYVTYSLSGGASGQYLALYGTQRNTGYGYSIWEMQIFRGAGPITQTIGSLSSPDPTATVSLDSQLTLSVGGDNSTTTFAGSINGGGGLLKTGTGTLTLLGTDTYSGGTYVEAGTLVVDSPVALNDGTSLIVGGNANSIFAASPLAAQTATSRPAVVPVPEPGTLALLFAGLLAAGLAWRKAEEQLASSV